METKKCCICGKEFKGWGNNPWPYKSEGDCCDDCNLEYVIPMRLSFHYKINTGEELNKKFNDNNI